jgi:hypothetical protein
MLGPANQIKWVLLRSDVIRFHFLARVERGHKGFVPIRINKMILYNIRIERNQMRIVFLIRIDMNYSII